MAKKNRTTRAQRTARFLEAKPDHVASRLYRAAAAAGVPLATVALAGGISRYSIYLWAAGDVEPRPTHATIARRLAAALEKATKAGDLPVFDAEGNDPESLIEIIRQYL